MTTQKSMARPSCKPLRATPFAPCSSVNNLHHYRGHYPTGVSQERLALEAGVDRTMLSKIERQISNPSIETLLKLANRLAVDIMDLVSPAEEISPVRPLSYRAGRTRLAAPTLVVNEPGRRKLK